jgi:hypothetical protein
MYAGESKGKFPSIQMELTSVGLLFAAGPRLASIYPEYLTDPAVLICPSDPNNTVDDFKNNAGNWDFFDASGKPTTTIREVDASYGYFGWVFDQCEDTDASSAIGTSCPTSRSSL